MYLVVCYDITRDRLRNRLHRRLKGYLQPVQKSVFEGQLSPSRYGELLEMIAAVIDHRTDAVRIYQMCRGCNGLTTLIGVSTAVPSPDDDLFI
jgi:CRISPR-associated protein Cas2